jgi:hypothetical protein
MVTITAENLQEWMIRIIWTAETIHFLVRQRTHVASELYQQKYSENYNNNNLHCFMYTLLHMVICFGLTATISDQFFKWLHTSLYTCTILLDVRQCHNYRYFSFPRNTGACVLVQHTAVNTKFLLTIFEGHIWSHLNSTLSIACQSLAGDTVDTIFWMFSFRLSSVQGMVLHTISFNT